MVKLKKIINEHKYSRVANDHRSVVVKGTRKFPLKGCDKESVFQSFEGYVLGDYLYVQFVTPFSQIVQCYRYFVGLIDGAHYRADDISYYIWFHKF